MTDRISDMSTQAPSMSQASNEAKTTSAKPEDVQAFEREMHREDPRQSARDRSTLGRDARAGDKGAFLAERFAQSDRARSAVLAHASRTSEKGAFEGASLLATNTAPGKDRSLRSDDDGLDLLSQLFSQNTPVEKEAGPAPAQPVAAEAELDREALEALTSRILVSVPDDEGHEVRLTLSEPPLEGTEICIRRDSLGRLSVTIIAGDPNAFQTLVEAQGDLAGSLQARERDPVAIRLEEDEPPRDNDDGHSAPAP